MITNKELASRMASMQKYFPLEPRHSSAHHDKVIRTIAGVMRNATRTQLLIYEPADMLACAINVLFHCEAVLHAREHVCEWKQRRKVRAARACYDQLLRTYVPERAEVVVETIIGVLAGRRLWENRTFCYGVIHSALMYGAGGARVVRRLWDKIVSPDLTNEEARAVIGILYELLDSYDWPETHETVTVVEKLLKNFYDSIVDARMLAGLTDRHEALKKGVELCVRNIIKHLPNDHLLVVIYRISTWTVHKDVTDDVILHFGSGKQTLSNVLSFTLSLFKSIYKRCTLPPPL